MIYSTGVRSSLTHARTALGLVIAKNIETSEPVDLDITLLKKELEEADAGVAPEEKKAFAKPRGPTRVKR